MGGNPENEEWPKEVYAVPGFSKRGLVTLRFKKIDLGHIPWGLGEFRVNSGE